MDEMESLSHTKWECKYHVVFIPKCRRKVLYGELRRHLGEVFRRRAEQKESRIEEGHLLPDQVHMMIAIPPKYAGSQVVGFIKGKSAIHLARVWRAKEKLCGAAFLGARVLGIDCGPGRDGDPGLHSESGARGPAIGPNEPVALTGHRTVAPNLRAALATRLAALSGSQPKAPPALPGDTYWVAPPLGNCSKGSQALITRPITEASRGTLNRLTGWRESG